MKILTVGDGDLSFSLSLKRAYPQHIQITVTTLLQSPEELLRTYSNSADTVRELEDKWGEDAEIIYGVDCCKLEARDWNKNRNCTSQNLISNVQKLDLVMFNHPHLGDSTLYESEAHHACRHHALLSHYFYSAAQLRHDGILSPSGRVHVCLCGTQPKTWDVMKAAERNGWKCVLQEGTALPVHRWLFQKTVDRGETLTQSRPHGDDGGDESLDVVKDVERIEPTKVQAHYPCPRKYRNGKLGSKHFLGRYGYRHRRTGGVLYGGNDADMSVHQSINFIFEFMDDICRNRKRSISATDGVCGSVPSKEHEHTYEQNVQHEHLCSICEQSFPSKTALHAHLRSPALPDINTGNFLHAKEKKEIADGAASSLDVEDNKLENVSKINTTLDTPISIRGSSSDHLILMGEADCRRITDGAPVVGRESVADSTDADSCHASRSDHDHEIRVTSAIIPLRDEMKLAETVIPRQYASKRLKWLCRQSDFHPFSNHIRSKKQCTDAIRDGRIYLNGTVAKDSSRIVKEGDVLVLLKEDIKGSIGIEYQHTNSHTVINNDEAGPDRNGNSDLNFGVELKKIMSWCSDGDKMTKFIVAYKPVGIRTVGKFSDRTLESITKSILERDLATTFPSKSFVAIECTSITKLDTGCAGLCLLIARAMKEDSSSHATTHVNSDKTMTVPIPIVHVTYHFTALVFGAVPCEWDNGVYVKLSDTGSRRWKRQKADTVDFHPAKMEKVEHDICTTVTPQDLDDSLFLRCTDRYHNSTTAIWDNGEQHPIQLSTVVIHSSRDAGRLSNVICYHLRKIGYPVVNDRFCKRELAALPRIMRNILKNKLCVGCFALQIGKDKSVNLTDKSQDELVSIDPHPRTQCCYWRENGTG